MSLPNEDRLLYSCKEYSLWQDRVEQGLSTARAVSATEIHSNHPSAKSSQWRLTRDVSAYPQLHSELPIFDALYSMSLEELEEDTNSEGMFDAGAEWKGVWTRDVSYSIVLALAMLRPDLAKASLLHKVKRDRIVQDTGTGGSWPVSSDRTTWALAAWEIYLVNGDLSWLSTSYAIIRNSILDDQHAVIDPASGLAKGESSFLDWREQTYPRWMEPVDIYESRALGTNAVFYQTYRILASMAKLLGQDAEEWNARAEQIRARLNAELWNEERGFYGQYLYGRLHQHASPRFEALGEALCILYQVASPAQQDRILLASPLMSYGVPTVSPQAPATPPYHNCSVWPFVQAFWNLAAASRKEGAVLLHGLASIQRAAALFLSNKENFVADTGDSVGTQVNSDRQLWSVAGNLAMTYRVLFGISFHLDGLHLNPVIPQALKGTRTLTNFAYRGAILSIEIRGFGSEIDTLTLDGKSSQPLIASDLVGSHRVAIQMSNNPLKAGVPNLVNLVTAPDTPVVTLAVGKLSWPSVINAAHYRIYKNGGLSSTVDRSEIALTFAAEAIEYQVSAIDSFDIESYLSAPVLVGARRVSFPAGLKEDAPFVVLDTQVQPGLTLSADLQNGGHCLLSFWYANGSGPVNTDNKCATRTLWIDDEESGVTVFPQRGQDDWNNWGLSSSQQVVVTPGPHRFELRLSPPDTNMNVEVNRVLIASLEVIFLD